MTPADLASIVASVDYLSSGYGALVKAGTLEVIALASATGDLYDYDAQAFRTISQVRCAVGSRCGENRIEHIRPV
jgi:hypothetical protein